MARTFSDTPEPRYVERALNADNAGEVTPTKLAEIISGDEFISADLNDTETKVVISFDQNYKPWVVELTGNSGTVTDAELAELSISESAKIINNDEYYIKADVQEGFMVFVHVGRDNQQQMFCKAIYVYTDSESEITYKTWTLVSTQLQAALPAVTVADAGKVWGVTAEGTWGLITLS